MNFRNLPVVAKLGAVLAISAVGMLAGLALLLLQARSTMYEDKIAQATGLVDQAMAVLRIHHRYAQDGTMPEDEAKRRAAEIIAGMRHGDNDYFWLQDRDARVVMHPLKPELNGKDMADFEDPSGQKIFTEFARIAGQAEGRELRYLWPKPGASEPQPKLAHVALFAPWGWVVGTGVYIDDVEALFRSRALVEGGSVLACMLLAGVLMYQVTSRYICRPLDGLQVLMHRVESERDLTLRMAVDRSDEIGQAGRSFNRLLESIQASLEAMGRGAQEVAAASEQLAAAAGQVRHSSEEQSQSASSMSAAVEEMTVSIAHVSDNTQQVRELGERSHQQEDESARSVEQLESELGRVQDAVTRMESTMQEFLVSTQAISSLTRQVRDISEQTNLLALNAAIESARAGEQGRGFAVVADEVRKLAEKSARSAAEIDAVTRSVGERTTTVEAAMAAGNDSLTTARTLMAHVTEVLHGAQATVTETRTGLNDISCAMAEQSSATNLIAKNVEQIADMAEENTAAAVQTSEAAERLHGLAAELKGVIQRFRVA